MRVGGVEGGELEEVFGGHGGVGWVEGVGWGRVGNWRGIKLDEVLIYLHVDPRRVSRCAEGSIPCEKGNFRLWRYVFGIPRLSIDYLLDEIDFRSDCAGK